MSQIRQHVKCTNLGCDQARPEVQPVAVHEDTVLPVRCGGCHSLLLCDHVQADKPVQEVAGSAAAPITVVVTRCVVCGEEMSRTIVHHEPVDMATVPAAALALMGVPLTPRSQ